MMEKSDPYRIQNLLYGHEEIKHRLRWLKGIRKSLITSSPTKKKSKKKGKPEVG